MLSRGGARAGGKKVIFIIDDDVDIGETLGAILADRDDLEVHVFAEPLTALVAMDTVEPDVAIVDYIMPGIDGKMFIESARLRHPGVAFLLMTAVSREVAEALARKLQVLVIIKPFEIDAFEGAVEMLTRKQELRH
jgi:DNA-binding NtrC family response regulator